MSKLAVITEIFPFTKHSKSLKTFIKVFNFFSKNLFLKKLGYLLTINYEYNTNQQA